MVTRSRRIDFAAVNQAALRNLLRLLREWLPGGRIVGTEYVARNPLRDDRHLGSFKINLLTGRWADFACGATGGDVVSLVAYLKSMPQADAARLLADGLGVDPYVTA
jgi:hypothetical protein